MLRYITSGAAPVLKATTSVLSSDAINRKLSLFLPRDGTRTKRLPQEGIGNICSSRLSPDATPEHPELIDK
ncbi:MAG: Uncharacterised protein [Bacteroidia bacterium]|nr:MAG: Uncharacterised protein [Bacteroidia bacterium]